MLAWYHRLGLRFIDLLILAIMLVYLTTSTTVSELSLFSIDFFQMMLIVSLTYVGVVVFVSFLCSAIPGDNLIGRFSKGAVSGLLVFFMFPWLLNIVMFLVGYNLQADAQTTLFIVSLARSVIRALLGRHWEGAAP